MMVVARTSSNRLKKFRPPPKLTRTLNKCSFSGKSWELKSIIRMDTHQLRD